MSKIKSKKVGVFSDIHIGVGQDCSMWHDISLNFAKWASEVFEKENITDIFIPGDIFHNRSEISVKTLYVAKQFFDNFREFNIYISTGNHDVYLKNSSDIHSLSLLNEWQNITIIDKEPKVYETNYGKTISFIPWGTELENFPKSDIMFAHLDIQSFYMNGYTLCEHGFQSNDLFEKSKYIISGHFHRKDIRKYNNGTIQYLGSPYQMNFGEVSDQRGVYIFDLEEETFEFIENTVSPVHQKIKVSDLISQKIKAKDLKHLVHNNLVCLIIDAKITPDVHSVLVSKLKNIEPKSLKIEFAIVNGGNKFVGEELDSESEFNVTDIGKTLEEYVEKMDSPHKNELKEYLKNVHSLLK